MLKVRPVATLSAAVVAAHLAACQPASTNAVGVEHVAPPEIARTDTAANFTEITSVAVTSRGTFYIADFYARQISFFSPTGDLEGTLGRSGSGPGEFRQLRTLRVTAGDSLDVYDSGNVRLSVYAPGSNQLAYEVDLRPQFEGGPTPREAWRFAGDSTLLALFEERHQGPSGFEIRERLAVYRSESDSVIHAALAGPKHPMLRAEVSGNSFATPDPFRRGALITVGPTGQAAGASRNGDTLYVVDKPEYTWTHSIPIDYTAPEITASDRQQFIESVDLERFKPAIRQVIEEEAPPRWAPVTHVRLDDVGRLWLQLGTRPDARTLWWVIAPSGERVLSVSLPPDANVLAVLGDRVYASRESLKGEPYLSIFDL